MPGRPPDPLETGRGGPLLAMYVSNYLALKLIEVKKQSLQNISTKTADFACDCSAAQAELE